MKGKGRKYTYLLSIVSVALVLSACDSSARYSDHFDFTGTVSELTDEHTKGVHPSDEWYGINNNNFWAVREFTDAGYTASNGTTYTHFYLEEDISAYNDFWIAGGNNVLCLNGHNITDSYVNNPLFWQGAGTFELCDCCMTNEETGGKITGIDDESNSGGAIHVNGGTFIMDGGVITGNDSYVEGGAIYVYNGEFILNDGYITNNGTYYFDEYDTELFSHGGAVAVGKGGVFTMNGGLISGNYAYDGGGVYVEAGGTANIYGGQISGNYATNDGAGIKGEYAVTESTTIYATINMADTPYVKDNYLTDTRSTEYNVEINDRIRINLVGEFNSGAAVGVTSTSGACQITSTEEGTSYYEGAYQYFSSDYIGYDIQIGTNCLTFDDDQMGTIVNDFTLNFEFYYENTIQTLPVWGNSGYWAEIYVEGSWNDWENGLEELSANSPDDGTYSLHFDSIALGVYYFQAVLEYNDSIIEQTNFENKITGDLDLEFRIPSSAIATGSYTVRVDIDRPFEEILEDPRDTETNVTFEIDFLYKGENYQIPSWTTISLGSYEWTDLGYIAWYLPTNAIELVENIDSDGNYYYAYTFKSLHVYTYETWGYAQYNGDHYWNSTREPITDPNVIYFDVLKTEAGDGQVIHQTIDLGYDDDLSKNLPNLGGTGVDTLDNIALSVTVLGEGLSVPDYGYLVLIGPFEVEGNSDSHNVEYPLTLDSENSTSESQVWTTDVIDSIGMDNYVADVEFRYYDDDYNSPGNMSVFNDSTHCYYYLWSSTANSATIYNYNYGSGPQASLDIKATYPGYNESSISFSQDTYDVGVEGTVQTAVTITPEDGTVTYESSDTSVATIDENGKVTGHVIGETTITATVRADGYFRSTATATINVTTVNSFAYHITLLNSNGENIGEIPSGYYLIAAGSFDGTWDTGGWWDWGSEYVLTWNSTLETYDLVLDFIPEPGSEQYPKVLNLYVSESTEISGNWDDYLIASYTIGESPNAGKVGDVNEDITMSATGYVNWNQIIATMFPDTGDKEYESTTDFYVVVLNHGSSAEFTQTTLTCQTGSWQGTTVFDGKSECSVTEKQTSAGEYYVYNSVAATATPGDNYLFYLHNNWDSSTQLEIPNNVESSGTHATTIEVPQVTSGHVAIYICACDLSNISWGSWTSFDNYVEGGWITSYSSVEALMATYTTWL